MFQRISKPACSQLTLLCTRHCRTALTMLLLLAPAVSYASGPRWVAGVHTFDPAAKGHAVVWAGGQVSYYIDGGNLSAQVSQAQTVALLNQAAASWNNVATAAVAITQGGTLAEDVNGSNVSATSMPADVQPTATGKPLAIIQDADGSVIEALYGTGASDPSNCTQDGIFTRVDNLAPGGTIAHAVMILNGRCATTSAQISLLQYLMVRAFGRILGLDWSQVNEAMFRNAQTTSEGLEGWPILHAIERECEAQQYACLPNPLSLRLDDIAGLNRLYPVTAANSNAFRNKQITAQATISVQGTLHFKRGQGMQGVNVTLTPITSGRPDARYQVSAVTGVFFHADAGNPVAGYTDAQGNPRDSFGTDDPSMEGFFDLSGVPLPPGTTVADYQLSFEPLDPLYIATASVGPYTGHQVTPSGTLPTLQLSQLAAGVALAEDVTIADSAAETHTDDGTETAPNLLPANGEWLGRLTGYGHVGWYLFPARANRVFTVEALALDDAGAPTADKAGLLIGFWDGSQAVGSQPLVASTQPFNGAQVGLTKLDAVTSQSSLVRLAFADDRGDGRPDFVYRARVLYADTVFPPRLPPAGGAIVIEGTGFRPNAQVSVNNVVATVTSVSPTEITAIAPPANGALGAVALTVSDPATLGTTTILDGLSYDAYGSDQIGVIAAPSGTVSQGVPVPFTVRVMSADNVRPAANVLVQFALQGGSAALGCGAGTCSVPTNGAGMATLMVTPGSTANTTVSASLDSGASVLAVFSATPAPAIAAVTPSLYLAAGGQATWQPIAVVLSNGAPVAGAGLTWSSPSAALAIQAANSSTGSNGQGSTSIVAGPLAAGASAALLACEAQAPAVCANFAVMGVSPNNAALAAVTGAGQTLAAGDTPLPVTLEVTDGAGHPLAGATVNFYEVLSAWQAPCPAAGRCSAPQVLARATVPAVSDANGMVTLTPLTAGGQPSTLVVNATTGLQGSLVFTISQHP